MNALIGFYEKWFVGPLGLRYRVREVGYSIGPLKHPETVFKREPYALEGFLLFLDEKRKRLRHMNLFLSIASYSDLDLSDPLYDAIHYDFDSREDPESAIRLALEFANSIKTRYGAEPVVFISGLHGARVVVPLAKPLDWRGYELLYRALIAPYRYASQLVDNNMLQPNRLDRIPYTWNTKLENGVVRRGFSYIVDLEGRRLRAEDFDWSDYEPLDPSEVTVYTVRADIPKPKTVVVRVERGAVSGSPLPRGVEELARCEAVPPCIRSIIDAMTRSGDLDHHQRVALVLYLKWVGFGVNDVVEFFRRYARDFNERITRYQVEYLYGLRGRREDWVMYSCEKMRQLGMCMGCGWARNPVTYTYRRASVGEEVKRRFYNTVRGKSVVSTAVQSGQGSEAGQPGGSDLELLVLPPWLQSFIEDTGAREFTYDDLKRYLEKQGKVSASEWHGIERTLRKLAEQGLLGRKYLVNGEWIDYGSRKVRNPPSKIVRFYLRF